MSKRNPVKGDANAPYVFVSFASADHDMVKRLIRSLGDTTRFWMPTDRLFLGSSWFEDTARAVRESSVALLFITPEYLSSSQQNFEAGQVLQIALGSPDRRVVPVLLRGVRTFDLPGPLATVVAIEGSRMSDAELVEAINAAIDKPTVDDHARTSAPLRAAKKSGA